MKRENVRDKEVRFLDGRKEGKLDGWKKCEAKKEVRRKEK